jgi:hypothetical protein
LGVTGKGGSGIEIAACSAAAPSPAQQWGIWSDPSSADEFYFQNKAFPNVCFDMDGKPNVRATHSCMCVMEYAGTYTHGFHAWTPTFCITACSCCAYFHTGAPWLCIQLDLPVAQTHPYQLTYLFKPPVVHHTCTTRALSFTLQAQPG